MASPTTRRLVRSSYSGRAAQPSRSSTTRRWLLLLDLQLARDLIERTRVSRLLRAYRDVPAVKPDAVVMVLVKLAQMAADIPEIRELDINPLLADETGVLTVDARVVVGQANRKFAGSGPANFAVRPYPSQWQLHLEVKDGWRCSSARSAPRMNR